MPSSTSSSTRSSAEPLNLQDGECHTFTLEGGGDAHHDFETLCGWTVTTAARRYK